MVNSVEFRTDPTTSFQGDGGWGLGVGGWGGGVEDWNNTANAIYNLHFSALYYIILYLFVKLQ